MIPLIQIINSKKTFNEMSHSWNSLLEKCENKDVLFSHQWYKSWINSFVSEKEIMVVAVKDSDGIKGLLPLIKTKYSKNGLKLNVIKSMTNKHSLRFDFICKETSAIMLSTILEKIFWDSGCKLIVLEKITENSLIKRYLDKACQKIGCKYLIRTEAENCLVKFEDSFNSYFNGLNSKFKKNVRAAERKALQRGPLTLLQPENEQDLIKLLERCLKIEENSWKGKIGSAVNQNGNDKKFYNQISLEFFKNGALNLSLLVNGIDDLSFFYCLCDFGTMRALKIAMDDKFRNIGPGMIIVKKVFEKVFDEHKHILLDFGGGWSRWKNDWSNQIEKHYKIFIFRNDMIGRIVEKFAKYYDDKHPYSREDL